MPVHYCPTDASVNNNSVPFDTRKLSTERARRDITFAMSQPMKNMEGCHERSCTGVAAWPRASAVFDM